MAVIRSVSKDEYAGGEGSEGLAIKALLYWSVMVLLGNSQEKRRVVSCSEKWYTVDKTSWCCITRAS